MTSGKAQGWGYELIRDTYQVDIFHKPLLWVPSSDNLKKQDTKTIHVTFLSETIGGDVLWINVSESPLHT